MARLYTREAKPFHVWNEGGVHELVCDSADDLRARARFGQSRCMLIPNCDWCNDTRRLTLVPVSQQEAKR
jgi:hypothetical protein